VVLTLLPIFPAHSLSWYRFIGRILGKAMYEGILVDVAFAGFFLAKVRSRRCTLGSSRSRCTSVAGETKLFGRSRFVGPRFIQWSDFPQTLHREHRRPVVEFHYCHRRCVCLFISVIIPKPFTEFGVTKTIDLIPHGSNIAVTKENRLKYIYLVSHYRLTKQIKRQSDAFFEGLSEMIDPKWLRFPVLFPFSLLLFKSIPHRTECLISKKFKFSLAASIL